MFKIYRRMLYVNWTWYRYDMLYNSHYPGTVRCMEKRQWEIEEKRISIVLSIKLIPKIELIL